MANADSFDLSRDEAPPPNYRLQTDDTAYPIERLLIAAWRAMSPQEKARQLADCCRALDALTEAGLRHRHPRATPGEIRRRLATLRLGPALAREVYGPDPEEDRTR